MTYRKLDFEKTLKTIKVLHNRISERFPYSGLSGVCIELYDVAHESRLKAEWIRKPQIFLRASVYLFIVLSLALLAYSIFQVDIKSGKFTLTEVITIGESVVNDIVFIGIAIFFLVTAEVRIKRGRALEALRDLRALSHVIDMHQLTKDPAKMSKYATQTASSPSRTMSAFELTRYLDYCSEMLALTGRISALYVQNFNDTVVLAAVNELETLTTSLSRKIWQKIIILHKFEDAEH